MRINFLGNEAMLREKLLSIPLHMCNLHTFEKNDHHRKCTHGDLGEDRDKPWLTMNSLVAFTVPIAMITEP